jgi:drug/metabolite transporter (DMT)-like permease
MIEEKSLINNDLKSRSSETIASSSSTVVNINNQDGNIKKYGSFDTTTEVILVPQPSVFKGIIDMFLSVLAFAIMHLTMKFLMKDGFPVSQLLLFRSVTNVLGCTIYAYYAKLPGRALGFHKDRFWLNCRGTLGTVNLVTFFLSMSYLQLGDTVALSFITPVVMPIASSILLGESYTILDAGATTVAVIGVAFISKPEFLFGSGDTNTDSSGLGLFYAVVAGISGALANISIRKVSKKSSPTHVLNYMMMWAMPVCLIMMVNDLESVKLDLSSLQIVQFLIVGIFSFLGQYWLGRSLQYTPAKYVSPIMFTEVFYAYINQFIFWGIMPTSSSTIGVLLVAFSLMMIHCKV